MVQKSNNPLRPHGLNQPSSKTFVLAGESVDGSKRFAKKWPLLIILTLVCIFVIISILTYKIIFSPQSSLELLPDPDLSGMEEQVAKKIQTLRMEVEKNPTSATAWGKLAMNLDIHDLKNESVPCYKQAAAIDATDFRWPYYCAIVLYEMGSRDALEWFERSRSLKPNYVPLHVRLGQALFDAGRLEESSHEFKRAIAADQNTSHAYLGLAQISLSQGDLQNSRQFLQKALEINPQHREVHGLMAAVYRRLNKKEKATNELLLAQQLPKITPVVDSVYKKLEAEGVSALWYRDRGITYFGKGLYEEAIREFQMALQFKPDPRGHNYVGDLLYKLKRYDEAASHYRAAIAMNPNYYLALNNLGQTLFEMDQVAEAIQWVKKSLRLNPRLPDAYINLGTFYRQSARTAEAIAILRRGLKAIRNFPPIALSLARLLATTSEDEFRNGTEALRLAKFVCEKTNFQNTEALDVLATAYAETGQFDRAMRTAQEALGLIDPTRQKELAAQIQSHLKLFKSNKPYRDE
ncbi:MAG: tetratricopeptide repeat protein [bacterium]